MSNNIWFEHCSANMQGNIFSFNIASYKSGAIIFGLNIALQRCRAILFFLILLLINWGQ